jgi:hypothetical protein
MRVKLVTIVVLLSAWLSACAVAIAQGARGTPVASQLVLNERAARSDARAALESVRLPAGVRPIAGEPRFARALFGEAAPSDAYNASDQAWWTSAASPAAIIAYVRAHRPAGASINGSGSGSDPRAALTSLELQLAWPPVGQQVYNRTLTLSVITPSHGDSAIVAQSQASWIVPRAASERVPAGVHDIAISLRIGTGPFDERHMHTRTYLVRRPDRVAAMVREINSLPITQPGLVFSCPFEVGGEQRPELRLQFRATPAGPALAQAQVFVSGGRGGASGWNACDPIELWIGGRKQTPLTSRSFVARIGRLIGAAIS